MPTSKRVAAVGASLIVVLACAGIAQRAAGGAPAPPVDTCAGRMQLWPAINPGYPWQHRNWLVGGAPFDGSRFVIVNMRTQAAHDWPFRGNARAGLALFSVPTRWTWLHPGWKDDPWLLVYGCDSSSGTPDEESQGASSRPTAAAPPAARNRFRSPRNSVPLGDDDPGGARRRRTQPSLDRRPTDSRLVVSDHS